MDPRDLYHGYYCSTCWHSRSVGRFCGSCSRQYTCCNFNICNPRPPPQSVSTVLHNDINRSSFYVLFILSRWFWRKIYPFVVVGNTDSALSYRMVNICNYHNSEGNPKFQKIIDSSLPVIRLFILSYCNGYAT